MSQHVVEFKIKVSGEGEKGFKKIEKASDKAQKSSVKYQKSIALLRKELVRLTTQRDLATDPKRVKALNREIEKTKNAINKSIDSTGKFSGALKKLGVAAAGLVVAKKIGEIGKASLKASGEMEKFNVTLRTMLGSKSAANARMSEYIDIAKKTPFKLDEVVSAGNQLQAIGRYSRSNLTMLGDLAAASGKSMDEVMGAYAKLSSGQKGRGVEMFRNLLITSQDWQDATGKGISRNGELMASSEELIAALPKIMQKKGFTGMMAAQAQTTEGMVSNLEDSIYGLKAAMGEKFEPTLKSVVSWMTKMTDRMEDAVAIPMAEKISDERMQLNILVDKLIDVNDQEEERKVWIEKIQNQYPEFLKNIDKEKVSADELRSALVEVNKQYDERIKKAVYADRMEELMNNYSESKDKYYKYEMAKQAPAKMEEIAGKLSAMGISLYQLQESNGKTYLKNGKAVAAPEEARDLYYQYKSWNRYRKGLLSDQHIYPFD